METNTRQGNVRTVDDCNKAHLHQVVICQENPLQKRTRSGPNQVNLITEGQEMIVEQRDKPSNFIETGISNDGILLSENMVAYRSGTLRLSRCALRGWQPVPQPMELTP